MLYFSLIQLNVSFKKYFYLPHSKRQTKGEKKTTLLDLETNGNKINIQINKKKTAKNIKKN